MRGAVVFTAVLVTACKGDTKAQPVNSSGSGSGSSISREPHV